MPSVSIDACGTRRYESMGYLWDIYKPCILNFRFSGFSHYVVFSREILKSKPVLTSRMLLSEQFGPNYSAFAMFTTQNAVHTESCYRQSASLTRTAMVNYWDLSKGNAFGFEFHKDRPRLKITKRREKVLMTSSRR